MLERDRELKLEESFLGTGARCISKNRPGCCFSPQAAVAGILVMLTLFGGSEGATLGA